ncbi:MAG: porin family protein [Candidatus Eisenbacteria bacterium]
MKKIGFALVLGTLMVGTILDTAAAQERPFELGFRFGLGVGMQSVDPGETDGSRVGITAGGVVAYPVTPAVALETGLLYELRGAKYKTADFEGGSYDATAKLDYLVIPAVAKMSFGPEEGTRPFVLGGLDLGFLMKAESDVDGVGTEDIKDFYKSTDFSLRLGGGVQLPAGGYDFVIGAAYALGLTDVSDFESEAADDAGSIKNRTLTVTAGVNF